MTANKANNILLQADLYYRAFPVETENINPLSISFDIAGNLPNNRFSSIFDYRFLIGNNGQIIDQIV